MFSPAISRPGVPPTSPGLLRFGQVHLAQVEAHGAQGAQQRQALVGRRRFRRGSTWHGEDFRGIFLEIF